MEIYLIRHTNPKIEKGICYGQTDLALADSFSTEAAQTIKKLPPSFDAIYSSPLKRCAQLASLLDEKHITDNRLMEMDFGSWELKKWDDIPLTEIQPWYDDFVNTRSTNGESYLELYKRVVDFYNEILTSQHQKIAIVSHAGVIRCFIAHINNIDLKNSFEYPSISYGGIQVLDV